MPTSIPARGRTLHVVGVCINRIGTLQFMSVVVWTGNKYLEYGEGKNDLDL